MMTSLVSSRNSPGRAFRSAKPSASQGTRLTATPGRRSSGRMTALCSMLLTMQWSPGRRRPEMIIFSPAVAPGVRITWVGGSGKSNSRASRCRSVSVTSPASWAAVYTDRFTLAPTQSR